MCQISSLVADYGFLNLFGWAEAEGYLQRKTATTALFLFTGDTVTLSKPHIWKLQKIKGLGV